MGLLETGLFQKQRTPADLVAIIGESVHNMCELSIAKLLMLFILAGNDAPDDRLIPWEIYVRIWQVSRNLLLEGAKHNGVVFPDTTCNHDRYISGNTVTPE